MRHAIFATTIALLISLPAQAKVVTKTIQYSDGDVALEGHMAWDDSIEGRRPGVLVVHEWWGLNDYARQRAERLAELGYVAFALDMYGKGKVTEHPQEAGQWAGVIRQNVDAWQKRALAGLEILKQHDLVDPQRLAAIGYCFGGATVCQMAYSGADLKGVVSFHGSLPAPEPEQASKIKAKLLVCHGAADAFIPTEQIAKFQKALEEADADWQMVYYSGARHSFTNPGADARGIDGLKYDKDADQRSWQHMQSFFNELFVD
jgi:dienelactone hydrolase